MDKSIILEDINKMREKIDQLYYIQEYEKAEEFEKMLREIEKMKYSPSQDYTYKLNYVKAFNNFQSKFKEYWENEGRLKKIELTKRIFDTKVREFIDNINGKDTTELLETLRNIATDMNEEKIFESMSCEINKTLAMALVGIFIQQIKKGETINLSVIEGITDSQSIVNELKRKLIDISKNKNEYEAYKIHEVCKELSVDNLENEKVWKILSEKDKVTFSENKIVEETKQNLVPQNSSNELMEIKKVSFWTKLIENYRKKTKKTTKYVIGYNYYEKTGEYEKYKTVYDIFPPNKEMKEQYRNCVELEINDVPKVSFDDISYMKQIKKLTIGENVKYINGQISSKELLEIEIHEGIESIGDGIFYKCRNLQKVKFPSSLKIIANNVFLQCESLENVEFKGGLEKIEAAAFYECTNLKSVKFPSSLKVIENSAFYGCESLQDVEFNEGLEEIKPMAFSNCTNLKNAKFPSSLKIIEGYAFFRCDSLQNIEFREGLESIGARAFYECTNLKSVKFPDYLKNLGDESFCNCENLESVELGKGGVFSWEDVFGKTCYNLKRIKLDYFWQRPFNSEAHLFRPNIEIIVKSNEENSSFRDTVKNEDEVKSDELGLDLE